MDFFLCFASFGTLFYFGSIGKIDCEFFNNAVSCGVCIALSIFSVIAFAVIRIFDSISVYNAKEASRCERQCDIIVNSQIDEICENNYVELNSDNIGFDTTLNLFIEYIRSKIQNGIGAGIPNNNIRTASVDEINALQAGVSHSL